MNRRPPAHALLCFIGSPAVVRRVLAAAALLASPGWAQEPAPDSLQAARAAVESGRAAAALPAYLQALAGRPQDADLLIEAARVHGFADRNADAAALYQRALAADPARLADIRPSLAWQLLWSAQPAAAAAWFEQWAAAAADDSQRADALDGLGQARNALGDQPGSLAAFENALQLRPQDLRLQRRRAMALLWNDRHAEALAALEQLVQAQPSDRASAWALANARNFAGLHRQAVRDFLHWPHPDSPGERADLARAWRWAGFEDRAWRLLRDADDADAAWLRDWRVRRELAPRAHLALDSSQDRDRLHTRALSVGAGLRVASHSDIDFEAQRINLSDPGQRLSATQWQAAYRLRLGAVNSPWGTAWTRLSLGQTRWADWQPTQASLRLRWVPQDLWRVDAQLAREGVLTPRAVANRVTVDTLSASLEHRPQPRWALAGGLSAARFDDGSTRWRATGSAEYAWLLRPRAVLGVQAQQLHRTRLGSPTDRGYWNPQRYQDLRLYAGWGQDTRELEWKVRLGAGWSSETDDGGNTTRGNPLLLEADLAWDIGPSLRLGLAAGASGPGLAAGGGGAGYWRRWLNVNLVGWF